MQKNKQIPIAIIGLGALMPGSQNAAGFWNDIVAGKDLMSDVPKEHWLIKDYYDPDPAAPDKTYCKRGAFLGDIPFDPLEFKIPPNRLASTDTSQLLSLLVAKQVLTEICKDKISNLDLNRAGVILGTTGAQESMLTFAARLDRPVWLEGLRQYGIEETEAQAICDRISELYVPINESTFPGVLGNVIAGRIANQFDFGGTNCIVDAACASSLAALTMAVNELQTGQMDLIISGGVDTMQHIAMYICFSKTPALSATGDCRPFSENADGTILGEGVCFFALKRLEDAEKANDHIYAVIRGIGSSSDGKGKSVHVPVAKGQAKAVERAYTHAGYSPNTVELVEAHGTATKVGDVEEVKGLELAFTQNKNAKKQWCALGSIKSQIGHTKGTAGAAGLFKAALSLHHKILPPTIKVSQPNPKLELETSPFYLNTQARPWIRGDEHPRRAGVSSFGFGGSNFHVALEEYTGKKHTPPKLQYRPTELLLFSAKDTADLLNIMHESLNTEQDFYNLVIALHSNVNNNHSVRLAIVADQNNWRELVQQAVAKIGENPDENFSADGIEFAVNKKPGKVACLFPGQGSQYINMGIDAVMAFDTVRDVWDQTAKPLEADTYLHEVVFPHPVFNEADKKEQLTKLTQSEWAQPAIGTASMALFTQLQEWNIKPDCVAGHSFGEITALSAAGCYDVEALVQIARKRGELMADATKSTPGAMTAISHSIKDLSEILAKWSKTITAANINSPKQLVVSGAIKDIEAFEQELTKNKISYKRLPVACAFHSPMMIAVAEPFGEWLKSKKFTAPIIPVYANTTAKLHATTGNKIKDELVKQLTSSVQFLQMIEQMYQDGVRTFIELGPNQVLSKLVKKCLPDKTINVIALDQPKKQGVTTIWDGIAKLFAAGITPDLTKLESYADVANNNSKPKNPAVVNLRGCNYGKRYPVLNKPTPPVKLKTEEPIMTESQAQQPAPQAAPTNANVQLQQQMVNAHMVYQKAMADSHIAFLHTVEHMMGALSGTPCTSYEIPAPTIDIPASTSSPQAAPVVPIPVPTPAPIPVPTPAPMPIPPTAPAPAPQIQPTPPTVPAPAPTPTLPAAAPIPSTPAQGAPKPAAPAAPEDMEAMFLSIIADKTGYPLDMLNPDMELEADLGIDSIKRVEILSAVQEKMPSIATVDVNALANMQKISEIIDYYKKQQ